MLEAASIKPTPNRMLVLRSLLNASAPLSLREIEELLLTLERSSILRVLTLLYEHDLVHTIEDGRGVTKYEICHGDHACSADDMHPHFYCERCNRVFCFDDVHIPDITVPEGYNVRTVNYMLKGVCPACLAKR